MSFGVGWISTLEAPAGLDASRVLSRTGLAYRAGGPPAGFFRAVLAEARRNAALTVEARRAIAVPAEARGATAVPVEVRGDSQVPAEARSDSGVPAGSARPVA
ncbi:hypothetical protein [Streptosporangium vulgare]|uniref:Uncharacterized protein n=1 Tax=Streptosporangium vulgare TaxID=46190 RepID=A0ABV5TFL8_9ACTN